MIVTILFGLLGIYLILTSGILESSEIFCFPADIPCVISSITGGWNIQFILGALVLSFAVVRFIFILTYTEEQW